MFVNLKFSLIDVGNNSTDSSGIVNRFCGANQTITFFGECLQSVDRQVSGICLRKNRKVLPVLYSGCINSKLSFHFRAPKHCNLFQVLKLQIVAWKNEKTVTGRFHLYRLADVRFLLPP